MTTKPTSKSVKPKAASLTGGMVRKGDAAPSRAAPAPAKPARAAAAQPLGGASSYHKALTLKLDRQRYEGLKLLGLREDKSSQELLTEALDTLLAAKR